MPRKGNVQLGDLVRVQIGRFGEYLALQVLSPDGEKTDQTTGEPIVLVKWESTGKFEWVKREKILGPVIIQQKTRGERTRQTPLDAVKKLEDRIRQDVIAAQSTPKKRQTPPKRQIIKKPTFPIKDAVGNPIDGDEVLSMEDSSDVEFSIAEYDSPGEDEDKGTGFNLDSSDIELFGGGLHQPRRALKTPIEARMELEARVKRELASATASASKKRQSSHKRKTTKQPFFPIGTPRRLLVEEKTTILEEHFEKLGAKNRTAPKLSSKAKKGNKSRKPPPSASLIENQCAIQESSKTKTPQEKDRDTRAVQREELLKELRRLKFPRKQLSMTEIVSERAHSTSSMDQSELEMQQGHCGINDSMFACNDEIGGVGLVAPHRQQIESNKGGEMVSQQAGVPPSDNCLVDKEAENSKMMSEAPNPPPPPSDTEASTTDHGATSEREEGVLPPQMLHIKRQAPRKTVLKELLLPRQSVLIEQVCKRMRLSIEECKSVPKTQHDQSCINNSVFASCDLHEGTKTLVATESQQVEQDRDKIRTLLTGKEPAAREEGNNKRGVEILSSLPLPPVAEVPVSEEISLSKTDKVVLDDTATQSLESHELNACGEVSHTKFTNHDGTFARKEGPKEKNTTDIQWEELILPPRTIHMRKQAARKSVLKELVSGRESSSSESETEMGLNQSSTNGLIVTSNIGNKNFQDKMQHIQQVDKDGGRDQLSQQTIEQQENKKMKTEILKSPVPIPDTNTVDSQGKLHQDWVVWV